jgi:hypothetical protein
VDEIATGRFFGRAGTRARTRNKKKKQAGSPGTQKRYPDKNKVIFPVRLTGNRDE